MILVITKMNVLPERRMELTQTITSLSSFTRAEKGCAYCEFCQNIEDKNRLFLLEEWDTEENLMTHLKSEHFSVLLGAMSFLAQPYRRTFHTTFHPLGMGKIETLRS
ncbi:MAG: antibiotic biosynthesis monooxygenase [Syntrophaceae bacterium]|nr:antibiotic biosynthesis monooxygenase [Syntrophaceae bacterium]